MASRPEDWFDQAEHDLAHARHSLAAADFEWACFAAQQATEKAAKAAHQSHAADAWGHSVTDLLLALGEDAPEEEILDLARELDKHYIPSRYPNAHPQGAPHAYYTRAEAARAIEYAETILRFCHRLLAR